MSGKARWIVGAALGIALVTEACSRSAVVSSTGGAIDAAVSADSGALTPMPDGAPTVADAPITMDEGACPTSRCPTTPDATSVGDKDGPSVPGDDAGCAAVKAHVVASRSDGFKYTLTLSSGTIVSGTVARNQDDSYLNLAYEEPQTVLWPGADSMAKTLFIQESLDQLCDPCAPTFEVRLLVRNLVATDAARTMALTDTNTQLTLLPQGGPGPACPGTQAAAQPTVPLTKVTGSLSLGHLGSVCAREMLGTLTCVLDTEGTFALSGLGPAGERLEITEGTFKAADQRGCR